MKRKVAWSLLTLVVLVGASLVYTESAISSSSNQQLAVARALPKTSNLNLPFTTTTFDVDRTDDTAANQPATRGHLQPHASKCHARERCGDG